MRWQHFYYVLAAFNVLALVLSLAFSDRLMTIYVSSLAENREWVETLHDISRLSELAAAVNAPGNDVFDSQDVEAEEKRLNAAVDAFSRHLADLRLRLDQRHEEGVAVLREDLQKVELSTRAMEMHARLVFKKYRAAKPQDAGKHMAAMDRSHAQTHLALGQTRAQVVAVQERRFKEEHESASSLQRFEYVIVALLLLMLAGALFYGRRLARLAEADQERRRQMASRTLFLKDIVAAQEDERRRIARDLHDEIGQSLTSVLVGLRTVEEAKDLATARERSQEVRKISATALDEVRRLARGLRPSILDDLGLAAALERYTADFEQMHGIAVELRGVDRHFTRLPDNVETCLYRIIQEALTNVVKHAQARHVALTIARSPGNVQLTIQDDGIGFQRTHEIEEPFGLTSMRERAALLGGKLTIHSQPRQGTILAIDLPVQEKKDGQDPGASRR